MVHPVESLALSLRDVCLAACRSSQPTDSGYDVGSHALARPRLDEFPDPTDNSTIVQHCVPSRFQALCDAFRDAGGQSDQDLVGKAFDLILSPQGESCLCKSMEWDMRYNEAENRSGLHLSDVASLFLWFKHYALP